MYQCTFALNDKPMSAFNLGAFSFPAFSGLGTNVNKRSAACLLGAGAIPLGAYFIVNRAQGGILGKLATMASGRSDWFALYAADGRINDEMFCAGIKRGQFRLHPKGPMGRSEGCVVIDSETHFHHLSVILRGSPPVQISGSEYKAYGTLGVA